MYRDVRTWRFVARSGIVELVGLAAVVVGLLGGPAFAAGPLAVDRPETAARGKLIVGSAAFARNAPLPPRFSAQGGNRSPPLQWTPASGAQSYALILEDPDAPGGAPFLHWVAWNIPASAAGLPEGVPAGARITKPVTMDQGRNGAGTIGYFGPKPPAGDPAHHYHFEVFAVDTILKAPPPGSGRDQLMAALRGHVVARGDVVATFQAK